jgi:cytochrome b subunit of formate dehydrogenase
MQEASKASVFMGKWLLSWLSPFFSFKWHIVLYFLFTQVPSLCETSITFLHKNSISKSDKKKIVGLRETLQQSAITFEAKQCCTLNSSDDSKLTHA